MNDVSEDERGTSVSDGTLEVFQSPGRQIVEGNDALAGVDETIDHRAADETRGAGNQMDHGRLDRRRLRRDGNVHHRRRSELGMVRR
ncbi:MAG TPA: hypothetical protein VGN14_13205, partial [Candidatus Elarobacter sp.]